MEKHQKFIIFRNKLTGVFFISFYISVEGVVTMFCPFCNPKNIILNNNPAFSVYDKYPVSARHMPIIPYRHFADYFEITKEERDAAFNLLYEWLVEEED